MNDKGYGQDKGIDLVNIGFIATYFKVCECNQRQKNMSLYKIPDSMPVTNVHAF